MTMEKVELDRLVICSSFDLSTTFPDDLFETAIDPQYPLLPIDDHHDVGYRVEDLLKLRSLCSHVGLESEQIPENASHRMV